MRTIIDDVPECFLPELALADVLVPVHARAEIGLGVVQVESKHLFQPNQRTDFTDGGIPALGRADVVAGRKEMSGIKTDAKRSGFLTPSPLTFSAAMPARRLICANPSRLQQRTPPPSRCREKEASWAAFGPGRWRFLGRAEGDDYRQAQAKASSPAETSREPRGSGLGGRLPRLGIRLGRR